MTSPNPSQDPNNAGSLFMLSAFGVVMIVVVLPLVAATVAVLL